VDGTYWSPGGPVTIRMDPNSLLRRTPRRSFGATARCRRRRKGVPELVRGAELEWTISAKCARGALGETAKRWTASRGISEAATSPRRRPRKGAPRQPLALETPTARGSSGRNGARTTWSLSNVRAAGRVAARPRRDRLSLVLRSESGPGLVGEGTLRLAAGWPPTTRSPREVRVKVDYTERGTCRPIRAARRYGDLHPTRRTCGEPRRADRGRCRVAVVQLAAREHRRSASIPSRLGIPFPRAYVCGAIVLRREDGGTLRFSHSGIE
jgi:hypothetical protein